MIAAVAVAIPTEAKAKASCSMPVSTSAKAEAKTLADAFAMADTLIPPELVSEARALAAVVPVADANWSMPSSTKAKASALVAGTKVNEVPVPPALATAAKPIVPLLPSTTDALPARAPVAVAFWSMPATMAAFALATAKALAFALASPPIKPAFEIVASANVEPLTFWSMMVPILALAVPCQAARRRSQPRCRKSRRGPCC